MLAIELLGFLSSNSWEIERSINDLSGKLLTSFQGKLVFTSSGDKSYLYEEVGRLQSEDSKIEVSKKYYFKEINNTLEVYFEDLRLFYKLDMIEYPYFKVEHICLSDIYTGRFEFMSSKWKTMWLVRGPNKNYTISSVFTPWH